MDDFEDKVARSPWAKDIHILGYVNNAELAWLYQHCLVNLYPSHYEGFGLPVLEGMSLGALAICSSSSSMPEVVGDAGILLPTRAREEWIHTLQSGLSDQQKLNKLKEAAAKRTAKFSWQRRAEKIKDLYRMPAKKAQAFSRTMQ